MASFDLPKAEQHAREFAARLNAECAPRKPGIVAQVFGTATETPATPEPDTLWELVLNADREVASIVCGEDIIATASRGRTKDWAIWYARIDGFRRAVRCVNAEPRHERVRQMMREFLKTVNAGTWTFADARDLQTELENTDEDS